MKIGHGIGHGYGGSIRTIPMRVRSLFSRQGAGNAHAYMFGAQTPVLGNELVVNGDFSNGTTGWVGNAPGTTTLSIVSSKLQITTSAGYGRATQVTAGFVAGRKYTLSVSVGASSTQTYVETTGAYVSGSSPSVLARSVVFDFVATSSGSLTVNLINTDVGVFSVGLATIKEILSYSDLLQGFHTGNYVESTGVTPASVDQPCGLVLDAAGSVVDVTPVSSGWGVVSGITKDATANTATFSGSQAAYATLSLGGTSIVGETYRVTATVSGATQGELQTLMGGVVSYPFGVGAAGNKTVTFHVKATGTGGFGFQDNGGQGSRFNGVISSIKIQQITGIHASQATSGYRPYERKGIVNLLTQNQFQNGLTDAPVRGGLVTLSSLTGYANAVAFGYDGTTLSYAYKTFTALANTPYTMAAVIKMDDGNAPSFGAASSTSGLNSLALVSQGDANTVTAYSVSSLGNGFYLVCETYQKVTPGVNFGVIKYTTNDNRTFKTTSYGLFTGKLTASQILAYGGIPLTTTAAASSSSGPGYLQFDGTDDRLPLGAPLFQMSDDHCVVAAVSVTGTPALVRDIFTQRGATGTPIVCELNIAATTSIPVCTWRDDAGALLQLSSFTPIGLNTIAIVTGVKIGNTQRIRVNGVTKNTSTTTFGATTITSAAIGGDSQAVNANNLNGNLYAVLPEKGTLTDADILLLEQEAASLAGGRLVGGNFVSNY